MKGIDVSNHNGYINWNLVKNSGINVVYIKATEGTTYIDPFLNSHYNGANSAGLTIGFYHFLTGLSAPETQAENFYNNIKGKNFGMKLCLDAETTGYDINNYIKRFINKLNTLINIPVVIYTGAYFAKDNIDTEIKSNYPLWVAHYGVNPWNSGINTGFNNVIGHQYTNKGSVSGVAGSCDLNVFKDEILTNTPKPSPYVHNDKIAQLQEVCNKVINVNLIVDSYWGPLTDAAVRRLPLAGLPYKTPELTVWIQLRLGLVPDGIFGRNTYNAVIWWQKRHNLAADGIAGYNTIKSLAYA